MVKNNALMDRGNTLHASTPATGMATLCGSSTVPVQDKMPLAYSHAVPQPLRAQLPRPQPRSGVPVYVMLPLDTVNNKGQFQYASTSWFKRALGLLQASGVEGIAVDVWWGAIERQPGVYDWSGYQELFGMVKTQGLRIQAVMSFHACGGNVGDYAQVPLPEWVLKCGERDVNLFCTDRPRNGQPGTRNNEYISPFADQASVLQGRTPLECYADFMHAFREAFLDDIGLAIHEIAIGGGPCGELRYPSYVETQGWRFPGAGEFMCYDERALASLAAAAAAVGEPDWGKEGPHDAGEYNSWPEDTGFFRGWGGAWDSSYGQFFMKWYSDQLLLHGQRLCKIASCIFSTSRPPRCTPRYHSTHPSSPLDPMSLVSNLASVLRCPLQHPAHAPQQPKRAPASQCMPLHQPSTAQGCGLATGNASTSNPPNEPLTPASTSAPKPSSWPDAYQAAAQDANEAGQEQQLQFSSLQPSDLPQPLADVSQSASDCSSHSAASTSSSEGGIAASQSLVSNEDNSDVALSSKHLEASSAGHVDSLPYVPYEGLTASSTDEPEAPSTKPGPDRSMWRPEGRAVEVSLKIAGVHWWYNSRSHAAELTAGYYNTEGHDGYDGILELCAQHGMVATLTCVEMCDAQHPPEALCGPEGLLRQVREGAAAAGVLLGGENALPCFVPGGVDQYALDRIVYNTKPWFPPLQMDTMTNQVPNHQVQVPEGSAKEELGLSAAFWQERYGDSAVAPVRTLPVMRSFTFLRLIPDMMSPEYQTIWFRFMDQMQQIHSSGNRQSAG